MNIVELKTDIHALIDQVNDQSVLNTIKDILNNQVCEPDFWDELPGHVKKDIEEGLEQIRRGETISHEEMMKKHSKWL